jgi:hypothetical protein
MKDRASSWRCRGESGMGVEYRVRFSAPDAEAVAAVLRQFPAAREVGAPALRFDLGSASGGYWPQATVQVEPDGVYFCDHGDGSGRAWLGEVIARLVSAFGSVTIDEL